MSNQILICAPPVLARRVLKQKIFATCKDASMTYKALDEASPMLERIEASPHGYLVQHYNFTDLPNVYGWTDASCVAMAAAWHSNRCGAKFLRLGAFRISGRFRNFSESDQQRIKEGATKNSPIKFGKRVKPPASVLAIDGAISALMTFGEIDDLAWSYGDEEFDGLWRMALEEEGELTAAANPHAWGRLWDALSDKDDARRFVLNHQADRAPALERKWVRA